ncbi:MAG: fibrillarin-like rRNA/tRNA 2'-O-methyltransferase [Conexivisphaerales archaeon]|nr:fibrillarin-like rRNA/tRNA 2'-O-methyltransferase [Conexivisphaerales archaeon]
MPKVENAEFENVYWIETSEKKYLATKNLAPGISVYGERLIKEKGVEYRLWDPFRSKLAGAIIKGLKNMPIKPGSTVLYLGASTGTTISHVSDIIDVNGLVFGVEVSARVARELMDKVVKYRKNVIPIVEDARRPDRYAQFVFKKADVLYSDIAQPDATEITLNNSLKFLKKEGYLVLIVKARSIDPVLPTGEIIKREAKKLEDAGFKVIEILNLNPYDKEHGFILATA